MFVVVFEEGSVVIPTQVLKRSERNEKGYVVIHVCVYTAVLLLSCQRHILENPFADDRAPSLSNSFGCTVAHIRVQK